MPGARQALRRIGREVDALGVISGYTRDHISGALVTGRSREARRAAAAGRPRGVQPGGGTCDRYGPGRGTVRPPEGSRPPPRRMAARPRVSARQPPARRRGRPPGDRAAASSRPADGRRDPARDPSRPDARLLPRRAPSSSRPYGPGWRGLYAEGLGVVACEAAASGLPVVVGDSGGAPDTVVDGVHRQRRRPGRSRTARVRDRDAGSATRRPLAWRAVAGRRHVTDLVGCRHGRRASPGRAAPH